MGLTLVTLRLISECTQIANRVSHTRCVYDPTHILPRGSWLGSTFRHFSRRQDSTSVACCSYNPENTGSSIGQAVQCLLHCLPVRMESGAPFISQAKQRPGFLVHKRLFDFDIPRLLQLAHVRGEIALGQAGFAHQEHEIRADDHVQVSHQHEPGRFVDELVDVGK